MLDFKQTKLSHNSLPSCGHTDLGEVTENWCFALLPLPSACKNVLVSSGVVLGGITSSFQHEALLHNIDTCFEIPCIWVFSQVMKK